MQNSNNNGPTVSADVSSPATTISVSGSTMPPVSSSILGGNGGIPTTLPPAPGLPHPGATVNTTTTDDICTILVVGFPEDMQEREFQNMFTFCPGFESAMLKTPTVPSQEESTTVATPTATTVPTTATTTTTTTTTAATTATTTSTVVTATNTTETTATTNGAASPPLSSASSASSVSNGQSAGTPKKVRIGFAKFRNRLYALEARNVLNGRRVDPQSGATLKVELAKKNLQMKRLSVVANNHNFELSAMVAGPPSAGISSQAGFSFPAMPTDRSTSSAAVNTSQRSQSTTSSDSAAFNAFYSVPSTPGALGNEMMRKDYSSSNGYDFFSDAFKSSGDGSRFPLPDLPAIHTSSRSLSFSHSPSSARRLGDNDGQDTFTSSALFGSTAGPPNSTGSSRNGGGGDNYSMISRSNSTSATGRTFFGREITTRSMTTGDHVHTGNTLASSSFKGSHSSNGSNEDQLGPLNGRLSQLSINTQLGGLYGAVGPNIGPLSAPAITAPRNPIPADQNPPCNTLYVGNLPVNAQEDELRRLFSRQRGYKRLCFRPKPGTGPMCFVEFDDVACATHAMNELYGTPLSNSIKGGIRLSYSKNPLGVRQTPAQQQHQVHSTLQQQQQQQLQQLRQAQLASFSASPSGHPPLSMAQQQQLAQMKAASAMKQRLDSNNNNSGTAPTHLGRLSLTGLATSTSLGSIGMTPPASSTGIGNSGTNGNGSSTSGNSNNGASSTGNPSSSASSPMQEPPSFRWLMEAL